MKLTVIIPARNEKYLQQTIDDILANSGVEDMEVIVGLDEYWPDPPLKEDPRVVIYHSGERIGMRPMINKLVSMARGKYVMKTDAHCAFDKDYCSKLISMCKKNYTVLGARYELDAEKWERKERTVCDFRYLSNPEKDDLGGLRSLAWHELKQRYKGKEIAPTMTIQGSGWLMHKEQFDRWGGLDERHGTFGQEGAEISCKTWLSGGKVLINRNTWYAHWNRGKAPYALSNKHRQKSIDHSIWLWMGNNWPLQKYSFNWLIEKFWPVPGWEDYFSKSSLKAPRQGTLFKGLRAKYTDENTDLPIDIIWEKRIESADPLKKGRLEIFYLAFGELIEKLKNNEPFIPEETRYWEYLRGHINKNHRDPLTDIGRKRLDQKFNSAIKLFKDIRDNGLKAPLEFYNEKGSLILFRGYRRLAIVKALGYERVPVVIHQTKETGKRLPAKFKNAPVKGSITELGQRQFQKYGGKATDKYWCHGYLPIYDSVLGHLRNKKIKILEIGVARGASHALWYEAFPKAHIYGVDKNTEIGKEFTEGLDRVQLMQGKQQDINFLKKEVIPNGPFDIIIDDCGHNPANQKITFDFLYPHLKEFGFYVMEDCYVSFLGRNKGRPNVPMELTKLIKNIYRDHTVLSVQFFYNLCIVQKGLINEILSPKEIDDLRDHGGHI